MKKYEIAYTYIPEPEVETGFLEIEAESDEEALSLFEDQCEDDYIDIKRVTCFGGYVDPNQLTFNSTPPALK